MNTVLTAARIFRREFQKPMHNTNGPKKKQKQKKK